jgi:hypothetical protein
MGERISVDVNMTGLSEAVAGLQATARASETVAAGIGSAAKSAAVVGRETAAATQAERTFFQEAKARGREAKGVGRVLRGGAMLGMMGVEAGLNLVNAAAGEGPASGIVKSVGGVIGGTMTGAMTGAMLGGPVGAAVGGGLGLITSGISALSEAIKPTAELTKTLAGALDQASKALDHNIAMQFELGRATEAAGVGGGVLAATVDWLAKQTGMSAGTIADIQNALGDQAANQSTMVGALTESSVTAMAGAMQKYRLTADQIAKMAIAADDAKVPFDVFIQLMRKQGEEAVRGGSASSVGDYMRGAIGGINRGDTALEMAANARLGSDFGAVTDVLAAGGASDKEMRARAALGVTEGMTTDQQRAVLASAAAGGASLEGTGVEKFKEVLAAFGTQAPALEQLGKTLELARQVQDASRLATLQLNLAIAENSAALRASTAAQASVDAAAAAEDERRGLTGNDQAGI